MLSSVDATYEYDANGNTTKKTVGSVVTTYTYDIDNRLVRVALNGANVANYYYDVFGRRLWKEIGGSRRYFFYTDDGLVGEYDGAGIEIKTYGYAPNSTWSTNPLFQKIGSDYYWYQNDHLGTPQKMTDSSGAVVWSVTYDAFGKATVTVNAIENNLRFPGQYYDAETGYHYNGHRYYDPRTGRYVTADPIGLEGGVNLFSYSDVNPINKIDMSGLAATSNGCGPDDWRGQFVTDNPMGIINFKPACDKHDICYGECQKKELCDKRFCEQTKKLCSDKYSGRIFSFTLNDCNELAKIYCDAVTKKGKSAHDNACEKKKCADMKRIQVLED